MIFYCPNCQQEVEAMVRETLTTKNQRLAYKANCPRCGQDLSEFMPPTTATTPPAKGET